MATTRKIRLPVAARRSPTLPFPTLLALTSAPASTANRWINPSIMAFNLLAWVSAPRGLDAGAVQHRAQTQSHDPTV